MTAQLLRVINAQTLVRSILLDKIDESQGNTEGYAQKPKQKVYVPYQNPLDSNVKGYIDLVPTDNVQLANGPGGVITKLAVAGRITTLSITSAQVKTPTVTAASDGGGNLTITGTTFTSIDPDLTYVILTNTSGVKQTIAQADFGSQSATQIVIANSKVTIGTPTTDWKVQVKANSKLSNNFTV